MSTPAQGPGSAWKSARQGLETPELAELIITAIIPPLLVVRRKSDGLVETLAGQEKPRLQSDFRAMK